MQFTDLQLYKYHRIFVNILHGIPLCCFLYIMALDSKKKSYGLLRIFFHLYTFVINEPT